MSGERRTFCVTEHLMNTHSATNRYAIQLIKGMVVDVTYDHNRKQLDMQIIQNAGVENNIVIQQLQELLNSQVQDCGK